MSPEDQQRQLDRAFDRIEETILPCIGMLIDTLLDASEQRHEALCPQAYAAELRTLALQVEELTRDIEAVSPSRREDADEPRVRSARG